MRALLAAALVVFAPPVAAQQTAVQGDARIEGRLAIGATSPSARFEVKAASAAQAVFQVSGVDETPFLSIDRLGLVALSTTAAARADVWGMGDSSDTAVQLLGGSLYPSATGHQVLLGYAGTATMRHAWRTRHSTGTSDSSVDFLLWTPAQGNSSVGAMAGLSLVTASTGAAVHVRPAAGNAATELVVSNGSSLGGGTMHRAVEATHSSRDLKTDISYLDGEAERTALGEIDALRPVRFRYKAEGRRRWLWFLSEKGPVHRGLLYEEAPASVRGPGKSVSVDQRVANAELAAKELIRQLESARADLEALKGGRR